MKRLFLVRHAKSSWGDPSLSDFDRPLNRRGKQDAPQMGAHLKQVRGVSPDLIASSPARRARSTARRLARALDYPVDDILWCESLYEGGVEFLHSMIRKSTAAREMMVVGHNPDMALLAGGLSGEQVLHFPTCGVFCLDFPVKNWSEVADGLGKKVFFDVPRGI